MRWEGQGGERESRAGMSTVIVMYFMVLFHKSIAIITAGIVNSGSRKISQGPSLNVQNIFLFFGVVCSA